MPNTTTIRVFMLIPLVEQYLSSLAGNRVSAVPSYHPHIVEADIGRFARILVLSEATETMLDLKHLAE